MAAAHADEEDIMLEIEANVILFFNFFISSRR